MTDTPKEPPQSPDQPTLWNELPETDEPAPDQPAQPALWDEPSDQSPSDEPADEPTAPMDGAYESVRWDEVSAQHAEADEPVAAQDDAHEPWQEAAAAAAEPAPWRQADEPVASREEPASWNEPSGQWPQAEEPAVTAAEPAAWREADEPVAAEGDAGVPASWSEPSGEWPQADEPTAPISGAGAYESVRWDEVSAQRAEADEPVAAQGDAQEPVAWNEDEPATEPTSQHEELGRWDKAEEPAPWRQTDESVAAEGEAHESAGRWDEAAEPTAEEGEPEPAAGEAVESEAGQPVPVDLEKRKRISGAGVVIGVLLALLGFALVVQVKSNTTDNAYASAREGDLLQIMSDLDSAERRLQQDLASLQATKRELASGAAGQEAAEEAAKARADYLGILAGTLQARGPGVEVRIDEVTGTIKASSLLNAVQELRGGGAEAIQIDGTGGSVRVIASTSFVDSDGGIRVDGRRLTGPYTIIAIGDPDTLSDAVQFAGGVVPRVRTDGGNVIVNKRDMVEIKEVRPAPSLEFARPVS